MNKKNTTDHEMNPEELHKALFAQLVIMLSSSALQQMGKLVDPSTGKAEANLDGAQVMIDMLDMIEAKTRGNRDAEEDRMLQDVLQSLKFNFFETVQSAPAATPAPAPAATPAAETPPAPGKGSDAPPPAGGDKSKEKYHKTYG